MLIYDLSNMLQSTVIVQLMSQDDVKAEIAHVALQNIQLYAQEFLTLFAEPQNEQQKQIKILN